MVGLLEVLDRPSEVLLPRDSASHPELAAEPLARLVQHDPVTASGQGANVQEASTLASEFSGAGFQSAPTPYPANADNASEIRHKAPGALIWPYNFNLTGDFVTDVLAHSNYIRSLNDPNPLDAPYLEIQTASLKHFSIGKVSIVRSGRSGL